MWSLKQRRATAVAGRSAAGTARDRVSRLSSIEWVLLKLLSYPVPKHRRTHYRHDCRPVIPSQVASGNATGLGATPGQQARLATRLSIDSSGGERSLLGAASSRPYSLAFRDAGVGTLLDGNVYNYLVKNYLDACLPPTLPEAAFGYVIAEQNCAPSSRQTARSAQFLWHVHDMRWHRPSPQASTRQ